MKKGVYVMAVLCLIATVTFSCNTSVVPPEIETNTKTSTSTSVWYNLSYESYSALGKRLNWTVQRGTADSVAVYVNGVKKVLLSSSFTSDGVTLEAGKTSFCVLKDEHGNTVSNEVSITTVGDLVDLTSSTAKTSGSKYSKVKLYLSAPSASAYKIYWKAANTTNVADNGVIEGFRDGSETVESGSPFYSIDVSSIDSSRYLHFCIIPVDAEGYDYKTFHIYFYGAGNATQR